MRTIYVVVVEDLYGKTEMGSAVSTITGVFTNKVDAIELAIELVNENDLILSGDLKWYDDEGSMVIYITEEVVK